MELMKNIRDKWNKFMLQTNSIDTILTEKVNEYILLEEQPLPITIGDKIIFIGNLNFNNEQKFFHTWALLLSALASKIINMELVEERKKELIEACRFDLLANGKYLLEFLWTDKWLYKNICKLIGRTILKQQQYIYNGETKELKKWKNCSLRYFKKNITKEKLIQICWLIYLYNFDSSKKNLKLIIEKMGLKQLEQTYIPFWLQNLAGLNGKFLNVVAENTCSFLGEEQNKTNGKQDNTKRDDEEEEE